MGEMHDFTKLKIATLDFDFDSLESIFKEFSEIEKINIFGLEVKFNLFHVLAEADLSSRTLEEVQEMVNLFLKNKVHLNALDENLNTPTNKNELETQ